MVGAEKSPPEAGLLVEIPTWRDQLDPRPKMEIGHEVEVGGGELKDWF